MKRHLFFLITTSLFILDTLPLSAKSITKGEANIIAAKYITIPNSAKSATSLNSVSDQFYIYNDMQGKGFVIISNDDCINPVIGYSDSGNIDMSNLPPQLKAYMDDMKAYISKNSETSATRTTSSSPTIIVAPLIKTKWYQLEPYNNQAPLKGAYTGCVATAMAQIMYYHKWPESGRGSYSYTSHTTFIKNYEPFDVTQDFTTSHYDWDNMLVKYQKDNNGIANWNETQANAVSLLMRDCGIGANMTYGLGESDACDGDAGEALAQYFGYDACFHSHFASSTTVFMNDIKKELDNSYPILFTGHAELTSGGGHAFVVDGYDSNDYLHVNWGWNGESDGYFNLGLFNPSSNLYSGLQVFTSIHPNKTDLSGHYQIGFICYPSKTFGNKAGIFVNEELSSQSIGSTSFDVNVANVVSTAYRSYSGTLSLALYDANGNFIKTIADKEMKVAVADKNGPTNYDYQLNVISSAFSGLADGDYTIKPVSNQENRNLGLAPIAITSEYKCLLLNIANNQFSIKNDNATAVDVHVKKLEAPSQTHQLSTLNVIATIANATDASAQLSIGAKLVSVDDDSKSYNGSSVSLISFDNTSSIYKLPIEINNDVPEGKYKIELVGSGVTNDVAEAPIVEITNNNFTVPELSITNLVIEGETLDDSNSKNFDYKNFVIDLKNNYLDLSFDFDLSYSGEIWPKDEAIRIRTVQDNQEITELTESLKINQTSNNKIELSAMYFEVGEYDFMIEYKQPITGEWIALKPEQYSKIHLTVTNSTGINEVSENPTEKSIYNMLGQQTNGKTNGLNIIRMNDGSVKKIIKTNK